jgi:hypothetical protein
VMHQAAINELATGLQPPTSCVWTGMDALGNALADAGKTCNDWTDNGAGKEGSTGALDANAWANSALTSCAQLCNVYCIGQ